MSKGGAERIKWYCAVVSVLRKKMLNPNIDFDIRLSNEVVEQPSMDGMFKNFKLTGDTCIEINFRESLAARSDE